jgi:hypothetical protein
MIGLLVSVLIEADEARIAKERIRGAISVVRTLRQRRQSL